MKIIISPAKVMKYKQSNIDKSEIIFSKKTSELLEYLKQYSVEQLHDYMKISFKMANTVYDYYHNDHPYAPAIFCYQGTVFKQLSLNTYSQEDFEYLNKYLNITLYILIESLTGLKCDDELSSMYTVSIDSS